LDLCLFFGWNVIFILHSPPLCCKTHVQLYQKKALSQEIFDLRHFPHVTLLHRHYIYKEETHSFKM
jgi:hypothetical protein